ncbi:MAG TPA: transposase [Ktedonobacteraceae bacterium]|nr:transposase [Ktedonobacteraceae bacterium]
MLSPIDDTTKRSSEQESASPPDDWQKEIVSHLPEGWEEQAQALKAWQRAREIRNASDLLRGLLAYIYTAHSFAHGSMWSLVIGLGDVSANGWRKRLRQANAWGQWLLQELLSSSSTLAPWMVREGWGRILLLDGTHLTCRGPKGMVYRVHTAFDLLAGRLTQLKVTNKHVAERLEIFDIQAGDLLISDAINSLRERVAWVKGKGADLVVRFNQTAMPLEEKDGTSISVLAWLKSLRAPSGRVCRREVWISHEGKRFCIRLIGLRLTAEQRLRVQRKKKREASKRQKNLSADTLYLAGWLLVVTTLPSESWSDQQVLSLYRSRWHIELIFKRIKQLLSLHRLRCTTAATALPTLVFLLLGWALAEEEGSAVRLAMREAMQSTHQMEEAPSWSPQEPTSSWWHVGQSGPLSEWMLAEITVDLLCQQIRGSYTAARYRACLPHLQRFLGSGHRKRPHWYSQACVWLGGIATDMG